MDVFLSVLSCFALVDCFWLRIDSFSACSLLGFFSFRFALIRIRPLYPFGGPPRGRRLERKGPVSEDTGPTPNRGCIQGHPTGLGHLPEEVVAHRLENGKKLARLQPALSMLADTIVPVDRRPLARVERDRPATAGRRCRASRGAAQRKGAGMRDSGKGPRGGPIIWLMAVIAVCLAPAVHPIAADVILTALAVWAMRNGR